MIDKKDSSELLADKSQKGSAIVIALFILALVSVFVALALTRSSAEAAATGNETAETRTFYAAQGSLETMTRNFNKVFEVKIAPTTAELDAVRTGLPVGLENFTFRQEAPVQTSTATSVVLSGGPFSGLYAIRDNWRLRTTAINFPPPILDSVVPEAVQVQLTRNVLNNRIPIFQFGIFYDDDLELYRPPRFSFGGRVHTNANFFLSPGDAGVYFDSRVTAVGQIVTQTWRNGNTSDSGNDQSFIKNASGVYKQLVPANGSVFNTNSGNANNIFASNADMPPSALNSNFTTQSSIFDGNLQNQVKPLKLPIKIDNGNTDLVEMVKRGNKIADANGGDLTANTAGTLVPVDATTVDSDIMKDERFANKPGIRISLSDSKAKLPGCASGSGIAAVTAQCGIRLDGFRDGLGTDPSLTATPLSDRVRGYLPTAMKDGYQATRANGERLNTGGTRQVWIKVETVDSDAATGVITTKDITADFLSLGLTEAAPTSLAISGYPSASSVCDNGTPTSPSSNLTATSAQSVCGKYPDDRSIIKLQRFAIIGPQIPGTYVSYANGMNVVSRYTGALTDLQVSAGCVAICVAKNGDPNGSSENLAHLKRATAGGFANNAIVPFPIEMYDAREGEYNDNAALYTAGQVTRNGVMSMVDIDVANLRRFMRGDFNSSTPNTTNFPAGLKNTDIPQKAGWVVYVSDRRGDADFDGEYDMEDIYGPNDGILQSPEDVNGDGVLEAKYINPTTGACVGSATTCEAPKYADTFAPDLAAVDDHSYYRRGVRLINGTTLPGNYDATTPANTRGFTLASENGVYVEGNYNATGAATPPTNGNTPYSGYSPFNTSLHIPASVDGDAITILSNAWNDAESFAFPYDQTKRVASNTTIRFAIVAGDSVSGLQATPNQGGLSPRDNGGVHNFKRYLESWIDQTGASAYSNRLDYSGSLINLFYSHNNNGSFKCCDTVYDPPVRNWVFDTTFLDPNRLPPGTPYFQYIQTTGFQRTNN